jgi:hypothetical protein
MGIPVPLFWLRTFYVEFRWSPDEVHLESRYIEYKYANSSIFQVDSRWTPDGYWSPAGVHLNSVGECKVLVELTHGSVHVILGGTSGHMVQPFS